MKYKKIFSGITVAIGMLMASQAQDWNGGGSTSVDLWRDGNVGIGLSSNPTYKLELDNGDMNILNGYGVKFGSIYGIRPASSSSPNFILGNGGMFGVGISPNYKLDVDGDLNLNTGVLRFGSAEAFTRLGSDFILGNSGGMFGVGITPAYKLDVDGDLNLNTGVFRLAGYEAFTLTGSDFILGNSGGMFGVGITPAYKLDVDGDVNIPSTFSYKIDGNNYLSYKGTSNILLGYEAGNALNIVGGTNIPSERNIFIGDNAGKLTEYSYNNIFIGHSSGFIQNSPSNLIGGNTFLGNSTGTNNNGYSNTFIGYLSGNDNIGNGNTFLGRESGVNYANFTSNVSNSVFVGKDAGQDLNTGNLISLLGYEATSADGLTNATAIGANAFVNQSNSLILGNNALVGIGNSAPQYTHHVTGGQRIEWHSLIGDLDGSSFNSVGGEGRLTVNSATSTSAFSGDNTTPFSHFFTKAGLFISHAGGNKSHGVHGIARVFSTDESAPSYAIGVEGEAYAGCETKGIGVKGEAYNNSVNVGIAGFGGTANELDCESNINIGVYGEADDQTPGATNYDYAAYNNGTVNVVGSLYTLSDEKFKSDITLFDNNIKKRFLDLRPVSYNYKYSEYPEMKFDKNPGLGFIAQEVEKVFPELVKIICIQV